MEYETTRVWVEREREREIEEDIFSCGEDSELEEEETEIEDDIFDSELEEIEKAEREKKGMMARSRSMNDMKLQKKKKKKKGEGRDRWASDIELYEGYLKEKMKGNLPRSRSMSDIKLLVEDHHQGYGYYSVECDLVYDRTNPNPANPAQIEDCTELAKLAIRFFNKENPHIPFSEDAIELVKVTSSFMITGTRYHLIFITKSHFQIDHPVFPFFESDIWYDRTPQVELVNIVHFW